MKILILSSNHKIRATRRIKQECEKRGHSVAILDPSKLYLYISSSERGYDKVYDGYGKVLKAINDRVYDAIIIRITNTKYASFLVEHFEINLNTYTSSSAEGLRIASDKFATQLKASIYGIRVPKTILFDDDKHLDSLVEKIGGFPIILKTRFGSQGKGVNLIKDRNTLTSIVQTIDRFNPKLILQEYIEDTEDYRAIVIGDKVIAAMKRSPKRRDEFRANISLGGTAEKIELTAEEQAFCIKSAKALNLDFCGVDYMINKNKELVLIEVNGNAGLKIEKITGVNIAKALIKHIELQQGMKKKTAEPLNGLIPLKPYEEIMDLRSKLKKQDSELSFFLNNPIISNAYEKFKGKTIEYSDRNNKTLKIEVASKIDIYNAIFNTVKL